MKPRTLIIDRTPCPQGQRVVVTAPSFDACQSETMRIMDDIESGAASFTYPVKAPDGQWVATGYVFTDEPHPALAPV